MAVTKIHKTSRMVFYVAIIVSLVAVALFFFGGQVPEAQKIVPDASQPVFTDFLLYWTYILAAVTIVVWLLFALFSLFSSFKSNPKKALGGLLSVGALAALLIVTYAIGDGTLLNIPGYDGSDNNPQTLKMTDMMLYTVYVMLFLTVFAIILSPVLKKRK